MTTDEITPAPALPRPEYSIRFATPTDVASDESLIPAITDLVNEVYRVAEDGLWQPAFKRTNIEDVKRIIASGQLVVAFLTKQGQRDMINHADLLGVVKLQILPQKTSLNGAHPNVVAEFGMLAVPLLHRSLGLGRALLDYAEQWARERGATMMQLEIVTPKGWVHPSKAFLAEWYGRRGYMAIKQLPFEQMHPALAESLAVECDYTVWEKDLVVSESGPRLLN